MLKPLQPTGTLIRSSWDQFRKDWRFHLEASVRLMIASALSVIASIYFLPQANLVNGAVAMTSPSSTNTLLGVLFVSAGGILSAHTTITYLAALLKKERGETATLQNQVGWDLFLPNLWISILQGLAVLGGFLLFVLPGIWLAIRLSFSNLALIDENKRSTEALKRSADLVKGRWWDVFLNTLAASFVFGLLMVGASLIFSMLISIITGAGMAANNQSTLLFTQLLNSIVQAIFVPTFFIFSVKLYTNLKNTL